MRVAWSRLLRHVLVAPSSAPASFAAPAPRCHLGAASASALPAGSAAAKAAVVATTTWTVADVARDGTLSLISGGIDDDDDESETQTREGVAMADKAAVARVRACVDGGGSVEIELDASDRIVGTRFQELP